MNTRIEMNRPGPWQQLFPQALELMQNLERKVPGALWSFGGGTVLMLRIAHRQSKDIDLFVPDPQYLGYVTPRLSDVAESITNDYEENAEFVKLFLPAGEIDIVVGQPLTDHPYEPIEYNGRTLCVETSAEIIAKKMWHRGDRAKARDLFDLCAVADAQPDQLQAAAPFMHRHGASFLQALIERETVLRAEFASIDTIGKPKSFDDCRAQAQALIEKCLQDDDAIESHLAPS